MGLQMFMEVDLDKLENVATFCPSILKNSFSFYV
jgi:hypothetical protein